ncbi:SH2 domain-containing protein 7 [Chanos chanos]|uniref:SH2 domain-containing protein 7 n=1 Tax=Chanos chanos TaxID=29144 RepID=A0A6J2ULQ4_CHACN|nr:SH2 domain-containing protein 7-like [Chanos chanos]
MEQTHTSMDLMKGSDRLGELQMDGSGEGERELRMDRSEGGLKDLILKWFMETQAALILCEGNFPSWFQGFISRQDAEDILRDKTLGCFLIRLSAKAIGYILSYRGKDRCRHFVINQNKEGLLVVSGDFTAHRNLIDLIEHFKTTPIQPFGEYLASTTTETSSDELYDVVQNKSSMRSCVSVQALCSLWDQRGDVIEGVAPNLPPKSSRRLTSSASVGSHALVQCLPSTEWTIARRAEKTR